MNEIISRKGMINLKLWRLHLIAALGIALTLCSQALAEPQPVSGPLPFKPLKDSAVVGSRPYDAPWVLPRGYGQLILSDENDLNIYDGVNFFPNSPDLNDMNTENETGFEAGRYLYRTHEVRPGLPESGNSGGAVSVVDTHTGEAKILVQRDDWEALDGIKWTPWGTLLFAEEVITPNRPDPQNPAAESGLLYEIFFERNDPTAAKRVVAQPAVGALSHEGIAIDGSGNLYVIDERAPGSIYKFVPDRSGDLSRGQLHALKVANAETRTGIGEWVPLDRKQVQIKAFDAAQAVGATGWGRPEDLEIVNGVLYAAITSEQKVIAITLNTSSPLVSNFVEAGINVPVEIRPTAETRGQTGFRSPDNLTSDAAGNLWIVEDNVPSDIWVATPDKNSDGRADTVNLFASMADDDAEGTGIYFGHDPRVLYVNVQHSGSGNDKTMVIFKVARDED